MMTAITGLAARSRNNGKCRYQIKPLENLWVVIRMAIKLMIKIYIPIGSIIYLPLHSIFIIAMNRMKLKKIINKHNPKAKPFFDFRNDPSKNRAATENTKNWRTPPTSPPYFPNIASKKVGVYHIIKKYNTWIRYGFNLL